MKPANLVALCSRELIYLRRCRAEMLDKLFEGQELEDILKKVDAAIDQCLLNIQKHTSGLN